jgi:hypothetical protein
MRRFAPAILCLSAVALFGCARVSTTTTLQAGGGFQRKVVYSVMKTDMGGAPPPGATVTGQPGADKLFQIPKPGPGVTVKRATVDGEEAVTVERTGAAGTPLQDITLMSDKGEKLASSTVTVTKLPDGRLEYIETLHWLGPKSGEIGVKREAFRPAVKKALAPEYQETAVIDKVYDRVLSAAVHVLFGPAEPAFPDLIINRDGASRRIARLLVPAFERALGEAVPQMPEAERAIAARKLGAALKAMDIMKDKPGPNPPEPKENSATNESTPLYFEVSFPGKIVETDGIVDPIDGTVYWSMIAAVLQFEDVRLRLVVQP